jgi:predicted nucleotidyltransferase
MHFYESSIITTKDGLHCQVYSNEHPTNSIIIKPKYIPTDKIQCDALQYRYISGKKMNRLSMWVDKEKLKTYITNFKENYSEYILSSPHHNNNRLFFSIPIEKIERIYFPRRGLSELMTMPESSLDDHLKLVYEFIKFLLDSGLKEKDLGVTYSTLMGHYFKNISDINIVVYGKDNFWNLMKYLETAKHPKLKWKTKEDWIRFHKQRNRFTFFTEQEFLQIMSRKKSEGYFDDNLFVIFGTEKDEEVWSKWGEEKYTQIGSAIIEGTVIDNFSSIVRPGCYTIKDSKVISAGKENFNDVIKKVVFYSRDYCMIAYPEEKIQASGILEKVEPKNGDAYYRIVVGYFDAYLTNRREEEFIKLIS